MKQILVIILAILGLQTAFAQLMPQSSLYMYNPIWNNPGVTGTQNALNATLTSRKMWLGFTGAPTTNYLAIHTPLKNESLAVGLQVINDKIGVKRSTGIMAMGAYKVKIFNGNLSFGIGAGVKSNQSKWSDVITTDGNDEVYSVGDQNYMTYSAGVGVYYNDKLWAIGLSIPNLLSETYDGGGTYTTQSETSKYSYLLMCSRKFNINEQYFIRPSTLIKYHSPSNPQVDLSIIGGMKYVEIGTSYRHKDSFSGIIRANVNSQFNVTYVFDRPMSAIKQTTSGSHEFMLSYTFIYHTNAPGARFL